MQNEIKTLLLDIEQYFLMAAIEDEARKVLMATMCLDGDTNYGNSQNMPIFRPT